MTSFLYGRAVLLNVISGKKQQFLQERKQKAEFY
jgi:hypothetical protein